MEWATELRPQTINELVGQEANKAILTNWIETQLPNAIILYGRSGSGKTTTARILAKAINADYIEMDAASHNGVEDARQLNDLASRLSLHGNQKIFCIDEAHALSNAAWQALLKTIEEPNATTHFIFATTEYNKLPATIRGRCRMLKFYSLTKGDLTDLAKNTLAKNNVSLSEDVVDLIVSQARGQARDLLKLLQSTVEAGITTREMLSKFLAIPDRAGMGSFIKSVCGKQAKTAVKVLKAIDTDYVEWSKECIEFIYALLEDKYGIEPLRGTTTTILKLQAIASEISDEQLGRLITGLLQVKENSTAYGILYALACTGV